MLAMWKMKNDGHAAPDDNLGYVGPGYGHVGPDDLCGLNDGHVGTDDLCGPNDGLCVAS